MSATTTNVMVPTSTPTSTPTLSPEETARRARVVARESERKAREAARIASDERRKATIAALSAKLNMRGAKVKAKNTAETFTPEDVLAALQAAREEGGEIRVSVSVPATEERDGRRFSLRLASD